jgi:hypothetical protein
LKKKNLKKPLTKPKELEEDMSTEETTTQYDSWDDDLREHQKARSQPGGKKFGFFWKLTESPVKFHPVRPEKPYTHPKSGRQHPFRTGFRHFLPGKGKRSNGLFVECGHDRGETCAVHAYANPALYGLANVKEDTSLATCPAMPYFAVSGFIEEEFHLVPELVDGREVKRRELCQGRGCEHCKNGVLSVFGKKAYLEFSPAQWQYALHPINKQIENSFCACGGDLFVSYFACANCGKVVLDVSTHCDRCQSDNIIVDVGSKLAICENCKRQWSLVYTDHKQLYEDSLQVYTCRECRHEGFLRAEKFCAVEGCPVTPMSMFDAQLVMHKSGEGTQSRVFVDSYSIQPLDERLFLPEFQGNDELAHKVVDFHKKALDLEYLLQPKSIDEQCKDLGRPNPFTADTRGTQRYVRYEGEGSQA